METSRDCHEQFDPANSPIEVERNESSNPLFGTVNVVNLSGDGKINQNAHSVGALVLGAVAQQKFLGQTHKLVRRGRFPRDNRSPKA